MLKNCKNYDCNSSFIARASNCKLRLNFLLHSKCFLSSHQQNFIFTCGKRLRNRTKHFNFMKSRRNKPVLWRFKKLITKFSRKHNCSYSDWLHNRTWIITAIDCITEHESSDVVIQSTSMPIFLIYASSNLVIQSASMPIFLIYAHIERGDGLDKKNLHINTFRPQQTLRNDFQRVGMHPFPMKSRSTFPYGN